MNIYTFKLTKKHIVGAVVAVAALVALLILLIPGQEAAEIFRSGNAYADSGSVADVFDRVVPHDNLGFIKLIERAVFRDDQ